MGQICTANCALLQRRDRAAHRPSIAEPEHVAERRGKARPRARRHHAGRSRRPAGRGAEHLRVIRGHPRRTPQTTIEVLTPDFSASEGASKGWSRPSPTVFHHNLETGRASTSRSAPAPLLPLDPADAAGEGTRPGRCSPSPAHCSGGARNGMKVLALRDDLRSADVDFLPIGQYLQPDQGSTPVEPLRAADAVKVLRPGRQDQRVPAVSSSRSPVNTPRRRGFRRPQGRRLASMLTCSSSGTSACRPDVRTGQRPRGVSKIPAQTSGHEA